MLTLSRSAGHLSSPINSNANPSSSNNGKSMSNQPNSSKNFHNSNGSLKSDKSDPNSVMPRSRASGSGGKGGMSSSGGGGLRDIFRVRLPGKKYSSPEEATLATLDSAIASGAGGAGGGGGSPASGNASHNSRKSRKKRSSAQRNSATESSLNKNGTWPRMMLPRNSSCSYTLPQGDNNEQPGNVPGSGTNTMSGPNSSAGGGHHGREMSFYGQYTPHNTPGITLANASNSMCVRRPQGSKERAPISNMIWDLNVPHAAKSVGAIAMSGPSLVGGNPGLSINSKSLTLAGPGRSGITSLAGVGGGLALDNHGLPLPTSSGGVPPHHRYSFGVFDPPSSNKLGKG